MNGRKLIDNIICYMCLNYWFGNLKQKTVTGINLHSEHLPYCYLIAFENIQDSFKSLQNVLKIKSKKIQRREMFSRYGIIGLKQTHF